MSDSTSVLPKPYAPPTREEETSRLVRRALTVSRPDMEYIAEKSGLSVHTLWSWHTGRRMPKQQSLKKLSNALQEIGQETLLTAIRLREWDPDR